MLFQILGTSVKSPVRLNKADNIPIENQALDVIGWGATDPNATIAPDILKETTLEYVPSHKCFDPDTIFNFPDTIICAEDLDGIVDEDSCQGDSGGPLIIKGWSESLRGSSSCFSLFRAFSLCAASTRTIYSY